MAREQPVTLAAAFGRAGDEALEARLLALCETARAGWPDVELSDATFVAHLARLLGDAPDLDTALAELHLGDLYLACGCALALPPAIARFHELFMKRVPAYVSSMRLARQEIDELIQTVADRLLVPRHDALPRIAFYAGRGPLEGWVRMATTRTALNLRVQPTLDDSGDRHDLVPAGAEPELDVIKQLYRDDFAAAFRVAVGRLGARERTLLTLHYLDGVPAQKLGRIYSVHRTTVGRWLEDALAQLFDETRRVLAERLRLTPDEALSLIRLLQSRLDITLSVMLRPDG